MADDTRELICPPYLNSHATPPKGTLPRERGVLTKEQIEQLNALKIGVAREDEQQLAAHPEVGAIVTLILRAVFAAQPRHVHEFVAEFVAREELRDEIAALLAERSREIEPLPSAADVVEGARASSHYSLHSERQRVSFFMEKPMSNDWLQPGGGSRRSSNVGSKSSKTSLRKSQPGSPTSTQSQTTTQSTSTARSALSSVASAGAKRSSHKELRFTAAEEDNDDHEDDQHSNIVHNIIDAVEPDNVSELSRDPDDSDIGVDAKEVADNVYEYEPEGEEEVVDEDVVPEGDEVPVKDVVPESEVPAEDVMPEGQVPAEDVVPEGEVPVEDVVPEGDKVPVEDGMPEGEVPVEDVVPEVEVPVEGVVPKGEVPVEDVMPEGVSEEVVKEEVDVVDAPEGDVGDRVTEVPGEEVKEGGVEVPDDKAGDESGQ